MYRPATPQIIEHALMLTLSASLCACPLSFEPDNLIDPTQGDTGVALAKDARPGTGSDSGPSADAGPPMDTGVLSGDGGPTMDAGGGGMDATNPPVPDAGGVQHVLNVALGGSGGGVVRSNPAGIDCGTDCTESYADGQLVTLLVTPDSNSTFERWTGACTGNGLCQVRMTEAKTVTAVFSASSHDVQVMLTGNGSGTVSSIPSGISCGNTCTANFSANARVTLIAVADPGNEFAGWSGACTGTSPCVLTVDAMKNVNAQFDRLGIRLTVNKTGNGMATGMVTSSPMGIDCGATCSSTYNFGTRVTLTAAAPTGTSFTGWSGACSGSNLTCMVTMNRARTVSANFEAQTHAVEVTLAGSGTGRVTSVPAGIDCGTDCREDVVFGTMVTLTAAADTAATFDGWSGDCTGTALTCTVNVTSDVNVTATFTAQTRQLNVFKTGSGAGTVRSAPAGIDCGRTCTATYGQGTMVQLSASASAGSTFTGWSGSGCSGTGTCSIAMTANRVLNANFDTAVQQRTLTVRFVGSGGGSVAFSPSANDCTGDCTRQFAAGTRITLTVTPDANSGFAGWGDACTGTGDCEVDLNGNRTVFIWLDQGLMLYLPFSGDASDASRRGHMVRVNGASLTSDRNGDANSAYQFGNGDYIEVASAADLSGYTEHTLCAWGRQTQRVTNTTFLIAKTFLFDNRGDSDAYMLAVGGPPNFLPQVRTWTTVAGGDNAATTVSNQGLPQNTWIHICGRYNGMEQRIYIDGQRRNSAALNGNVNVTSTGLRIGQCVGANNLCASVGRQFFGQIDEVKVWNRTLSSQEIEDEADR